MCDAYNKVESEIPAEFPDSAYDGLPEPVVARVPAAAGDMAIGRHAADAAFIAAVHESVLPLCDRVERAEAEVERLRADNARLEGELSVLRGTARPAGGPGRCTVCGWPLAESRDKGCVEGNCSYRPAVKP